MARRIHMRLARNGSDRLVSCVMTQVGYRFLIVLLASVLGCGCCQDLSSGELSKYPPLGKPSQIDGIYPGRAPAQAGPDLWEVLTGRTLQDRPGQVRQISVRSVGGESLDIVRLMNGVEVERQNVDCTFEDGYLRLRRSICETNVELTHLGCLDIAIASGKRPGEIAIYRQEHFWAFWCLIIPVPADPVPRWDLFRADPSLPPPK